MVDAVGTTMYGYGAAGQLLSEDGPWADDTVSYTYNNRLRASLTILAPNASPWTQTYGYDGARRLTSIASPAGGFGYTYDALRQAKVAKLSLPNGAYVTNTYDNVSRLTGTWLRSSANTNLNTHDYVYNLANQRTEQVFTAGNYTDYTYDNLGQLITARGSESGGYHEPTARAVRVCL